MRYFYLISYDISEPRRLQRIMKTVRDFGDRLQLSVFLCQLNEKELVELRERLRGEMNQKEDQVLFIRLVPATDATALQLRVEHLGRDPSLPDGAPMVF